MTKLSLKNPGGKSPTTPESKRLGWRNSTAVGITVAAVAALLIPWKCQPDKIAPPPEPTPCVAMANPMTKVVTKYQVVPLPPQIIEMECTPCTPPLPPLAKDDGKCELDRGEGDHRSKDFDPASCGRCGDGKADPLEVADPSRPSSRTEVADQIASSSVIFTGNPVPEGCLADTFTCDGPEALQGTIRTGVVKEISTSEGPVYELGAVVVGCDPPKPVKASRRMTPECGDDVVAKVHGLIVGALHDNSRSIRSTLGARDIGVIVTITANVDSSGRVVPGSGTVSCGGVCPNAGDSDVLARIRKDIARHKVASSDCTISSPLSARLPVEREGR
ncbi:MAG: hypothetical protein ABID61_04015 [Candidatus Micrarchaeota archaeon]